MRSSTVEKRPHCGPRSKAVTAFAHNYALIGRACQQLCLSESVLLQIVSSDRRESKLSVVPSEPLWSDLVLSILEIIHGLLYSCLMHYHHHHHGINSISLQTSHLSAELHCSPWSLTSQLSHMATVRICRWYK